MAFLSFYMESLDLSVGSALGQKQSTGAVAPLQGMASSKEADIYSPLEDPPFEDSSWALAYDIVPAQTKRPATLFMVSSPGKHKTTQKSWMQ